MNRRLLEPRELPAAEGAEAVGQAGPPETAALAGCSGGATRPAAPHRRRVQRPDRLRRRGLAVHVRRSAVTQESLFAFRVLPSIIFFAALMQALYYVGVMQQIVRGLGYVVQRTLGTTGPESLAAAANIFLGQTEAPLVVKPYVKSMTRSELMAIMVPGFGSTAGGVLIAYKMMGVDAGHLLTASLLSAPASLLIAKVMVPETEQSTATGRVNLDMGDSGGNLLEAISIGTLEGLKLALNVGAMLIAFLALIAMSDGLLGLGRRLVRSTVVARRPSWPCVFAPFAWIMGIPWADCMPSGQLLGEKMVANEFVAYLHLGEWMKPDSANAPDGPLGYHPDLRPVRVCQFQLHWHPDRRHRRHGARTPARSRQTRPARRCSAALANFMTACIAGMLL